MTLGGSSYMNTGSFSNGTGDMEFIFYAAADDWSKGTQVVIGHWPKSASKQAVRVQFNRHGHLQFLYKDRHGTLHVHNAFANKMGLQNGKGAWFRIRFNAVKDTKSITRFFVSKQAITTNPSKISWGRAVAVDSQSKARPRDVVAHWQIGAAAGGTLDHFRGDIAVMRFWRNGWSGNGGTQVIQMDMRTTKQASNGYASWTETGRTWNAKGPNWSYKVPTGTSGGTATPTTTTTTKAPTTTTKAPTTTTKAPTTTTTPPNTSFDVTIRPGDNIAAIVRNKPAGTSFYIKAGKYRMTSIRAKDGMKFVGEPGAVLSGAKKLTKFTKSGGLWVASGQTQGSSNRFQGAEWGYCADGDGMCVFPEQLFIGNRLLRQVRTKAEVTAGKWYFDYANDKIWFANDPTGKTVETSVKANAIWGDADNVLIEGLTMERYASPGRQGVVNPRIGRIGAAGKRWTVKNNVIRHSHAYGIKVESGFNIIGNNVHHMGQMGIGGGSVSNIMIRNNELAYNCIEGYKCFGFAGGALKLDEVTNVTIRANYVHDNPGHGLHVDRWASNVVYEDNVVVDNLGNGIHHEISGSAIIRNNRVVRNGFRDGGHWGIIVLSSSDVEVYGNTVRGNRNGILGLQDSRVTWGKLTNLWVHDNTIVLNGSARTGLGISGISDTSYLTSRNNRFTNNKYTFKYGTTSFRPFKWGTSTTSVSTWKSKGMDKTSTFNWK
jgi:parallel beta-helix repeat protein